MTDENTIETRNWVTPERVGAAQARTGYRLGTWDWVTPLPSDDEPAYQCCPLAMLVVSEREIEPAVLRRWLNDGRSTAIIAAELGLPEPYVRGVEWGVDDYGRNSGHESTDWGRVRSLAELRYGLDNRHALALMLVGYRHGQRLRRELRLDVAE